MGLFEPAADSRALLPQRLQAIVDLFADDPAVLQRIAVHDRLTPAAAGAAFVFEAAPERLPLKQRIFAELEDAVAPQTILASNSSAIPSTHIGRNLKHRDRVLGTHFWNPPHLIPLVEVIENEKTSTEAVRKTMELLRQAGKVPVHVHRDIPGFVGNRLQHAMKREAVALVAAGVCDAETVDTVVKEGFGARLAVLGPLEQCDLIGFGSHPRHRRGALCGPRLYGGPASFPAREGQGRKVRDEKAAKACARGRPNKPPR